jgi:hypothetical protein
MTNTRGLLASPGLEGQPVKATYFFPGEGDKDTLWTTHPLDPRDRHWNSDPSTRGWVIDRMAQAHVNTVVMSYWSNMPQWSPMTLDPTSCTAVLDTVEGRGLVVLPAPESGFDSNNPQIPHWEFSKEFPADPISHQPAPGLVHRIGLLVELFAGRMHLWAKLYDRAGEPRYAINIIHACSEVMPQGNDLDAVFALAFDQVAAEVKDRYGIDVGFTLDAIAGQSYSASPLQAGPVLEQTPAVLAIHGFVSEVFSGLVKNGPPCSADDWRDCHPHDNNTDNLERLADWRRAAVRDWLGSGVPVILDVSNGNDGRIVWMKEAGGVGFWGDNLDYTEDRWRNWMSQLKAPGIKGISFNTWNGYTEGYAAVPSREHGDTVFNWLCDLLEPDPRDWSHMHYVNGAATHRVYGSICEKWIELGADRGFGSPVSDELPSAHGRMQHFTDGKAIYWGSSTGAHELHGLIARAYREVGGAESCLGLPIGDEESTGGGRIRRFEHGRIDWSLGDSRARVTCQ